MLTPSTRFDQAKPTPQGASPSLFAASGMLQSMSSAYRAASFCAVLNVLGGCTPEQVSPFSTASGEGSSQDSGDSDVNLNDDRLTIEDFVLVPGTSEMQMGYSVADSTESASPYYPLAWVNSDEQPFSVATPSIYVIGDAYRFLGGTNANNDAPYNYSDFVRANRALQKWGFRAATHAELLHIQSYNPDENGPRSLYPWGDGNGNGDPTEIGSAPDGDYVDGCGKLQRDLGIEELSHCSDPLTGKLHGLSVQAFCGPIGTQTGDAEAYDQLQWIYANNLFDHPESVWNPVTLPSYESAKNGELVVCGGAVAEVEEGASQPMTNFSAHHHGVESDQGALYDYTPESCAYVTTENGFQVVNAGSHWEDDGSVVIVFEKDEEGKIPSPENFEEVGERISQIDVTDPIGPLAAFYKDDEDIMAWVPAGCEGGAAGFAPEPDLGVKKWTAAHPSGEICEFEVGGVYKHGDGQNCPTLVR